MAVLDSYLMAQVAHGASHFILQSGRPIVFVIDGQERTMTAESVAPESVVALLKEVAPSAARAQYAKGERTEFSLSVEGSRFLCQVRPSSEGPHAVFARADLAPEPSVESSALENVDEPAINRLFRVMVDMGASDLHLTTGEPPRVRASGDMVPIQGEAALSEEQLRAMLLDIAPVRNKEEFLGCGDTDFAYEIPGLARFRANLFLDRIGVGAVFRVIPSKILSVEDLGLPDEVRQLCFLTKGLVLVTGPTGSGKSTTLSALIDLVNRERRDHIITIEDPIEFVHPNKGCLINQREVRTHTKTFSTALRAALREDPDIILVGEMRDLETISIAIETAETGHLVFGTLHTSTAPSTVDRLIDVFPADRQDQIRVMLSESLKGVIAQTLCRKIGGGRVAAYEILIGTTPISSLIREGKTFQIPSIMQTGKKFGMCMLNDYLLRLVKERKVEPKEAYIKSVDKSGLVGLLRSNGIDTGFLGEVGGTA